MKPYKVINCPNYTNIRDEIISYIETHTTLLTNNPNTADSNPNFKPVQYPNFVNIKHFVTHNPKLLAWVKELNLTLIDVYFTLCWKSHTPDYPESSCPIHLDKPPVYWKLNFPLINMRNTSVRFFKLKDPTKSVNDFVTRTGIPDSKDHDRYLLPYNQFDEFDCHKFDNDEPIIMNGMIPHDVGFYNGHAFPRIGLQGMFLKEPIHLLDPINLQ